MTEKIRNIPETESGEFRNPVKIRPELEGERQCSECGNPLDFTGVCKKCGLISGKPVMSRKPQRFIDPKKTRPRADRSAGKDPKIMRNGIGHTSFKVKSGLDPEKAHLFRRLKKINTQKDGKTKRETRILIMIDKLAELLDLPDSFQRRIASLYRKLRGKELTQGKESRTVLGALTLIETRKSGYPRTQWEIIEALNKLPSLMEELKPDSSSESKVERHSLRNTLKLLREEFKIDVMPTKPIQYLARFATKLGLDTEETEKAYRISRLVEGEIKNTKPTLVTAAVLYLASADKKMKEVSKNLHVSVSALCRKANEIKEILEKGASPLDEG